MVQAMINIHDETNRVLNVVKAKYGLKDKSEAINLVVKEYAKHVLEEKLTPEQNRELIKVAKMKPHHGRCQFGIYM